MPDRRMFNRGLAFAVAGTAIAPLVAKGKTKSAVCQSCNGNGGCASNSCVNGLCAPYDNVCGTDKRPLYTCKAGRLGRVAPKCCQPSGRKCKSI